MTDEELKELIERKEQEIRDLLRLQRLISKKHLEKEIDLRLTDLHNLYEKRKKKS